MNALNASSSDASCAAMRGEWIPFYQVLCIIQLPDSTKCSMWAARSLAASALRDRVGLAQSSMRSAPGRRTRRRASSRAHHQRVRRQQVLLHRPPQEARRHWSSGQVPDADPARCMPAALWCSARVAQYLLSTLASNHTQDVALANPTGCESSWMYQPIARVGLCSCTTGAAHDAYTLARLI